MRKVIQITTDHRNSDENNDPWNVILALCDDGTLWQLLEGKWSKLPDIPQYQPKPQLVEKGGQ